MCARVDNQRSHGIVIVRFWSFCSEHFSPISRSLSINLALPLKRSGSNLLSVVDHLSGLPMLAAKWTWVDGARRQRIQWQLPRSTGGHRGGRGWCRHCCERSEALLYVRRLPTGFRGWVSKCFHRGGWTPMEKELCNYHIFVYLLCVYHSILPQNLNCSRHLLFVQHWIIRLIQNINSNI
jgi:hypothetical protein